MKKVSWFLCFSLLLVTLPVVLAEETSDANVEALMNSALQNYKAQKYAKALEDINWVKQQITNLHLQVIKGFLPKTIDGFQTEEVDGGSILGMHSVSRRYIQGEQDIEVLISGGNLGDGSAGLGAFMGMGSAFQAMDAGTQSQMIMVKNQKGRYNYTEDQKEGVLTFTMSNNVVIMVKTHGFDTSDQAKKVAEMIDFEGIEKAYQ